MSTMIQWIGIDSSRFVQGPVKAEEILVPREGACQDALWNKWEIVKLRLFVFDRAGMADRAQWRANSIASGHDPVMV